MEKIKSCSSALFSKDNSVNKKIFITISAVSALALAIFVVSLLIDEAAFFINKNFDPILPSPAIIIGLALLTILPTIPLYKNKKKLNRKESDPELSADEAPSTVPPLDLSLQAGPPPSGRPFFKGRLGIPNPGRSCSYISKMIIMSHIGLVITINPSSRIQNDDDRRAIQRECETDIVRLRTIWEQRVEQLQQKKELLAKKREELPAIENQIEDLRVTISAIHEQVSRLRREWDLNIASLKDQHHQAFNPPLGERRDLPKCLRLGLAIDKAQKEKPEDLKDAEQKLETLMKLKASLEERPLEIERLEHSIRQENALIPPAPDQSALIKILEEYDRVVRANRCLEILRGNIPGHVTAEEAQEISEAFFHLIPPSLHPYAPGRESLKFQTRAFDGDVHAFQKRLEDAFTGDWRVILVSSPDHFFTYVRNPNGDTVTEINNSSADRQHRVKDIHNKYKDPSVWRNGAASSEIEFF